MRELSTNVDEGEINGRGSPCPTSNIVLSLRLLTHPPPSSEGGFFVFTIISNLINLSIMNIIIKSLSLSL